MLTGAQQCQHKEPAHRGYADRGLSYLTGCKNMRLEAARDPWKFMQKRPPSTCEGHGTRPQGASSSTDNHDYVKLKAVSTPRSA